MTASRRRRASSAPACRPPPAAVLLARTLCALLIACPARAGEPEDPFAFFRSEAAVVTASRRPQPLLRAPASVHVLTAADIKGSGAQTVYDALRLLPGVDVMATRAFSAELSGRGMLQVFSNRTLVLLDGKTILNGFFDIMSWESLPVTLEEIDRIEVVLGPASALYGPSALGGVVNIITKTPEQLNGGLAGYTVGERGTHLGSALYGRRSGQWGSKLGLGWRSTNRFEDASLESSRAKTAHAWVGYDFDADASLAVSAGASEYRTQTGISELGAPHETGTHVFARVDGRLGETAARVFWNRWREVFKPLAAPRNPTVDFDSVHATVERRLELPYGHALVFGGGLRRDTIRSNSIVGGARSLDLWNLSFEDEWKAAERWTVVATGRLDHHPLAGMVFSPRGSLLFMPADDHTVRLSGGTSFRNPTLGENLLDFTVPLAPGVNLRDLGNPDLKPEKMTEVELAHVGRLGRAKTTVAVFRRQLSDIIATTPAVPAPGGVAVTFENGAQLTSWGGEAGAEYFFSPERSVFGNYSYIDGTGHTFSGAERISGGGAPKHKANAGVRAKRGGFTGSLWGHWVDHVLWDIRPIGGAAPVPYDVPAYFLLNGHAGYAFTGRFSGLEIGVGGFNLANRKHFEVPPSQAGEKLLSRWTANVSYAF